MRVRSAFTLASAGLLLLVAALGRAAQVAEVRVENRGGGEIEESSVLAFTSLKQGDPYSRAAVARDVRSLQKSGRFSYVGAATEQVPGGVSVTYVVKSKPRIRRLRIWGADELGNKKVRSLLELGAGDPVDDATLGLHSRKVIETYHKKLFPRAMLEWTIQEDPQGGLADVDITVKEGDRASVRRIRFRGNYAFKARTLRGAMRQRKRNLFSWLTHAGTYKPDDLAEDVETIRRMYMDHGYLDVQVQEPEIVQAGRKHIDITIPVREGTRYRVGGLALDGVTIFPLKDVMSQVALKQGGGATLAGLEKSLRAVEDYYGSRGYIKTRARYELNAQAGEPVVDVRFSVKEGELAHIRDILVRGNTRTKDKVIRRELAVYPGEIYDQVKVRTSERRLWNLGYFADVAAVPESTPDPARYDLAFEVQEQKSGQFMVGAGFSSVDQVIGFVELSQGNFDLTRWPSFTGGGQKLKLRGQLGTKRTDFEASFVEPWFLNRRLALGLDYFRHDRRFLSDEYDQKNAGGSVSLTKGIGRFHRLKLSYALEEIEVYNIAEEASDLIRQEEGRRTKSSMTLSLTYDSRDSVFVPTRGNRTTLSGTCAGGVLGADTDLYQLDAVSSQYLPLWFGHVLNLKGWASVVEEYGDSDQVPIFDRQFLGGARTVRGFRYRDIGPRDTSGEPIGGRTAAYATAEYSIPVARHVRFATFYDTGMVSEEAYGTGAELNSSWGVGVRFDIPGFPLRLDYAWPIETQEYPVVDEEGNETIKTNDQPSGRFSFLIGYVF